MRAYLILFSMLPMSFLAGCSHWSVAKRTCNPLGGGKEEDCFLPFPSSYYTRPDPGTRTGARLAFADASLPSSILGKRIDSRPYEERDGFSPIATLAAQFPAAVSGANLPDPGHTQASLVPSSPVQLLRFDTGERVPLFAELDANADPRREPQALILQPTARLRPRTRYVAVIQGLRTREGAPVEPLSGFRKLRDGHVDPGSRLAGERGKFEELFAMLAKRGVPRPSIQLAWDFTTGSDEAVVGRLVRMRDQALARLSPSIQVDRIEENPAGMPELARRIHARYRVASFLEEGNGNRLRTGPDGEPSMGADAWFPLTIHVPACARAATGPLPVMIYGHGTFNTAEKEMANDYGRGLINRLCMIQVGTDWLGRAKADLPYYLLRVLPNWDNFRQITDRLQQAHVNVAALARLVRLGALDEVEGLRVDGRPLADSKRLYYYGISEGGCQGVTSVALSPDIDRAAMNVPCGFWSMFFWRSSDFHYTRHVMSLAYPGSLERQKLMILSQLLWDYTDPANYGEHLLKDPLPGSHAKKILYQEGINDASVPNVTTRAMARTIGLKLLGPKAEPVEGIDEAAGPLESAYVQFDVGSRPRLGGDNVPPAVSSVHEDIRRLEAAQWQLMRFLREDGKVEPACAKEPCVFHL